MLAWSIVRIMMIRTIYRRLLASLMLILFFLGMTGFNIEEHKCVHCGTYYSIFLVKNIPDQFNSCNVNAKADCCSENKDRSTDKTRPGSCDINTEDCCKYSYDEVSVEDPVQLKSIEFDLDIPAVDCPVYSESSFQINSANLKIQSFPKRLSGRDVIVLNSQFLS